MWPYSEMEDGDAIEAHENEEERIERAGRMVDRALEYAPAHGGYPGDEVVSFVPVVSETYRILEDGARVLEHRHVFTPEEHAAMLDVHAGDDRWTENEALHYCWRVRQLALNYGRDFYRVLDADLGTRPLDA